MKFLCLSTLALGLVIGTPVGAQETKEIVPATPTAPEELLTIGYDEEFKLPEGEVLPDTVDLSWLFPPAGNQFEQGSCSGWALGYGLTTYYSNKARLERGDSTFLSDTTFLKDPANVFSPAFVYNLLAEKLDLTDCTEGVPLGTAVKSMCTAGCATWLQYPYDPDSTQCFRSLPDSVMIAARRHLMSQPKALEDLNWDQWRYYLSMGDPIAFVASIDNDYFNTAIRPPEKAAEPFVWNEVMPASMDGWNRRLNHIMLCVGYLGDSTFLVLNSWGTDWGQRGYVQVPLKIMNWIATEPYIMKYGELKTASDNTSTKVVDHRLGGDNRIRGGIGTGEVHTVEGVSFQTLSTSPKGDVATVEFTLAANHERICTLFVLEDQPISFQYGGMTYTFTYRGNRTIGKRSSYTLKKKEVTVKHDLERDADPLIDPKPTPVSLER